MQKLWEKIEKLPLDLKEIFDRIYEIKVDTTNLKIPEKLGSEFKNAQAQQIIVIKNKILKQETAFNSLRSLRPQPADSRGPNTDSRGQKPNCPFCNPKELTPEDEDEIGRLENESALTASNLAKALKHHSLIIFKKHNFADLDKNDIFDGFNLVKNWWQKISEIDNKQKCGFLIWNQGYRAGASILHPHWQIFASEILPIKFILIKEKILNYQQQYHSNYYDDLFLIHKNLGLAKEIGRFKAIISLTPYKDKEIIITTPPDGVDIENLSGIIEIYRGLSENFNIFLLKEPYENLPLGFMIDRGNPLKQNSDIGSLEIYAFSVVGFNPLEFAQEFIG